MSGPRDPTFSAPRAPTHSRIGVFASAARYLLAKAALIGLTICLGVFATVLIVNQPSRRGLEPAKSPFEISIEKQINSYLRPYSFRGTSEHEIEVLREQLRSEAGLHLPYWRRHLLWTYRALTFDWGHLTVLNAQQLDFGRRNTAGARDIVLQYFPNTLLLIATAYFLVFLFGIPLALYMTRHRGGLLDRLLALLSPVSSIPSWVIAILLVSIFAVELRWLPSGGMWELHRPEDPLEYAVVLAKHMVLPVAAIALSLFFQLIYTWRAYFVIHSEEDYVELGRAKGLPFGQLERRYVLLPNLPYVITSFSLTLVGFWQMTMALEVVFQWPGLGWLYITKALPNFWGESVYPGELIVAVGIVVIFAYLLGIIVFLLDVTYALVDPRIHLLSANSANHAPINRTPRRQGRAKQALSGMAQGHGGGRSVALDFPSETRVSARDLLSSLGALVQSLSGQTSLFFRELSRYPSAVFGAGVIAALGLASMYALVAYPYEKVGRLWDSGRLTGRAYIPRLAAPGWTTVLDRYPHLSVLVMDGNDQLSAVTPSPLSSGWTEKTTVFRFQYPYGKQPSEVFLYLDPRFEASHPFVSVTWICPDGRRLVLKDTSVRASMSYDFERGIGVDRLLREHPEWRNWFDLQSTNRPPASALLFAKAGLMQPLPLRGSYEVVVKSLLFEEGSNITSQLVILGDIYGAGGTDFWRRDLIVPLLWGMPFALFFGLLGATATTLVAMLSSAAAAWLGGWFDGLVQRFSEVNMILPVLAIGVLANAVWNVGLWAVVGAIVVLSGFGTPAKTFRAAFLQAREAPYIEGARAYGASDWRIIARYLVPRVVPVIIPQIVVLVPSFAFLEATLGIFNIKSNYPTWGRIIYDGLTNGALYGSRFWVLEPIILLLLTGSAFALMGAALERILNPKLIESMAASPDSWRSGTAEKDGQRVHFPARTRNLVFLSLFVIMAAVAIKSAAARLGSGTVTRRADAVGGSAAPYSDGSSAIVIATDLANAAIPTGSAPVSSVSTTTPPAPPAAAQPDSAAAPLARRPTTYTLQKGEFPFCIARRFDVDPMEMLALSDLLGKSVFHSGLVLRIPQTGNPFPGRRMLMPHPLTHVVTSMQETVYTIACAYGDVDPLDLARVNGLSVTETLLLGQEVSIP